MEYGCIGEHLTHSFSKEIHGYLGDYLYELKELPTYALDSFLTERDFKGVQFHFFFLRLYEHFALSRFKYISRCR